MDKKPLARILIVDDEPDFLATFSYWLSSRGYEAVCADSGEAAMAELARGSVDAILLDIMMPQMNGLETLKRMRAKGVKTPVMLLTISGKDPDSMVEFKPLDVCGFYQKQASLETFLKVLETALKSSQSPG